MSAEPFNVLAALEFAGADINAAPGSAQHSLALVAQHHAALVEKAGNVIWKVGFNHEDGPAKISRKDATIRELAELLGVGLAP